MKDAIRRRGENISAWEVEQVLQSHPDVAAAAVVPVPSELGEDEVHGVSSSRATARALDPVELIRHCEPRLAYFAIPRYIELARRAAADRERQGAQVRAPRARRDRVDLGSRGRRLHAAADERHAADCRRVAAAARGRRAVGARAGRAARSGGSRRPTRELNAVAALDDERGARDAADGRSGARRRATTGRCSACRSRSRTRSPSPGFRSARARSRASTTWPRRTRPSSRGCARPARSSRPRRPCPSTRGRYETESALQGRTLNAFDPARTSGGSSGGEGALIGADASIVGVGTDGGGSIRVPSHYNGIVGLRPSVRLVPETGCWPTTRDTGMLDMVCVGPMGRSVDDVALVLRT